MMHKGGAFVEELTSSSSRRNGVTAVHSLHRFAFSVPDLDEAVDFYTAFGLDVRQEKGRVDLYAYGNAHRWGSIYHGRGPKRLEYVSFGAYAQDFEALVGQIQRAGASLCAPHPLAEEGGVW